MLSQKSNGDKSDTVIMSVSTGCSDPGFNCLIASEETVNSEISPSASAIRRDMVADFVGEIQMKTMNDVEETLAGGFEDGR